MNRSNITSVMTNDMETQKRLIEDGNAIGISTEKNFSSFISRLSYNAHETAF